MTVRSTRSEKLSEGVRGAVNDLIDDLKRLAPEQGETARRNARAAVSKRLGNLRAVLDAEFPVTRRTPKTRKRRARSDAEREKRLAERGLSRVQGAQRERELLAAGVRIIPVFLKGLHLKYAAAWAVEAPVGTPVELLRKGRRSQQVRDALRAASKLTKPAPSGTTIYLSGTLLHGQP